MDRVSDASATAGGWSCANRPNDKLPLRWEERRGSECRMDAWPRLRAGGQALIWGLGGSHYGDGAVDYEPRLDHFIAG